jgi:hypothetical protein
MISGIRILDNLNFNLFILASALAAESPSAMVLVGSDILGEVTRTEVLIIRLGLGDLWMIFSAEECGMLVCNSLGKSDISWWMTCSVGCWWARMIVRVNTVFKLENFFGRRSKYGSTNCHRQLCEIWY